MLRSEPSTHLPRVIDSSHLNILSLHFVFFLSIVSYFFLNFPCEFIFSWKRHIFTKFLYLSSQSLCSGFNSALLWVIQLLKKAISFGSIFFRNYSHISLLVSRLNHFKMTVAFTQEMYVIFIFRGSYIGNWLKKIGMGMKLIIYFFLSIF